MLADTIRNAQSGNNDEMLALIKQFQPALCGYAKHAGYEDAYEDLVADFIEIIRDLNLSHLSSLDDGVLVRYLTICLRNKSRRRCGEYLKKTDHEQLLCDCSEAQQWYFETSNAVPSPEKELAFENIVSDQRLTPLQRAILAALYQDGLSVSEFSKKAGVSRQSINQAKNRALKTLRNDM